MVHVATICVIPYLLELILYALILALLSDAEKGEFSGFRRFLRKKFAKYCHVKRSQDGKERCSSLVTVVEDPHTDSIARIHKKCNLARRPSKSAGSSPTRRLRLDVPDQNGNLSVEGRLRSTTMPLHIQEGKCPVGSRIGDRSSSIRQSKRASVPFVANSLAGSPRAPAPWIKTVITARRNTRRKAFLMLSLNLILWLPYCAHAIISSIVDINFVNFQFASALVVFNAITNILL